mmetsp:Transcript_27392/g.45044  ORF Transcript_27392/g.45044 Transcript_27392/m.45044 type:complete len:103 (+) Transcript_27392:17-325(+)
MAGTRRGHYVVVPVDSQLHVAVEDMREDVAVVVRDAADHSGADVVVVAHRTDDEDDEGEVHETSAEACERHHQVDAVEAHDCDNHHHRRHDVRRALLPPPLA